jgi:hypothetical protein
MSGVFLHEAILDTFAHYLETTMAVSSHVKERKVPGSALALATVAVGRLLILVNRF